MPFDMLPMVPEATIVSEQKVTDADAIRVIERAQEIIRYPWQWTARALARDWRGKWVDAEGDTAIFFCGRGALIRAAHQLGVSRAVATRAEDLIMELETDQFACSIPDLNDNLIFGYFRVHRAFARAVSEHKA